MRGFKLRQKVIALLFLSISLARSEQLQTETINEWDVYMQKAAVKVRKSFASSSPYLPTLASESQRTDVRQGEIPVSSVGDQQPVSVTGGLIHHWRGTSYLPHTTLSHALDVLRAYDQYKLYYAPVIIESRALEVSGAEDRFVLTLFDRAHLAHSAFVTEYTAEQKRVGNRAYGVTYSTRIQEISHFGKTNEMKLPVGTGSGYIWRACSIIKLEEDKDGVYVELDVITLSRDLPRGLRWFVNPIIRRVARETLRTTLLKTQAAVAKAGPEPAVENPPVNPK